MASLALDNAAARFSEPNARYLSARRIAETLGVTLSELSGLSGVARNTLTAKSGAMRVDRALSPIARILAMASEMAGDDRRAALWFKHQPIPGWAGMTAGDLVRDGRGEKVLAYLEAVRAGVYP